MEEGGRERQIFLYKIITLIHPPACPPPTARDPALSFFTVGAADARITSVMTNVIITLIAARPPVLARWRSGRRGRRV